MIDELSELVVQATTERSHYYVKSVCERSIQYIRDCEAKLAIAKEALEYIINVKGDYDGEKSWVAAHEALEKLT